MELSQISQPHGAHSLKTWASDFPTASLGYLVAFYMGILSPSVATRNHAFVHNLKGKTQDLNFYK